MATKTKWNLKVAKGSKEFVLATPVATRERVRAIKRANVGVKSIAKQWVITKVK